MTPGEIPVSPPVLAEVAAVPPHSGAVAFGSDPSAAEQEPQQLFTWFEFYRESFGSIPSGEGSAQLMNALRGVNPNRLPIFPASHPRLNHDGELFDLWGSPVFSIRSPPIVSRYVPMGRIVKFSPRRISQPKIDDRPGRRKRNEKGEPMRFAFLKVIG